jgi:IS5 family transposase
MIEARRQQLHFGEGLIAEEVSNLREDWMKHADQVLEDEQLVATVYEALARRSPKSRTRGRRGTPAEVVTRLLLLKHIRNWSYEYWSAKSGPTWCIVISRAWEPQSARCQNHGRWGLALGPEGVEKIHERVVEIAQERQVVKGRKMRLDTTVVETNIHYRMSSQGWRIQRE